MNDITTIKLSPIQQFKAKRDKYNKDLDTAFDEFLENNKTNLKDISIDIYYSQTQESLKLYKEAIKEYYEQE